MDKSQEREQDKGGLNIEDGRIYNWEIVYDESHFGEGIYFVHKVEGKNKIEAVNNWLAHLFRSGLLSIEREHLGIGVDQYI